MNQSTQNEIGRELLGEELILKTIVCIRRDDRKIAMTMWVSIIERNVVVFLAGAPKPSVHFMTFRRPDGTLVDDTGKQVHVYQYLGKE
jgi:hypothetical protein